MAEVASFVVELHRDRTGRVELRLSETGTIAPDGDFDVQYTPAEADDDYDRVVQRKYPAEYARAKALHEAFERNIANLNEDLRVPVNKRAPYCSCEPDDACPSHALIDAAKPVKRTRRKRR